MKTILIILMIILALMELWMYFRLHGRELRLEQRIKYVESREESAREAMKRNGETAEHLNKEIRRIQSVYDYSCKVSYTVTAKDRQAYSSEKMPAVVKSRIANTLGHQMLKNCPGLLKRIKTDDSETYVIGFVFRPIDE
jgi:hypothetical protein